MGGLPARNKKNHRRSKSAPQKSGIADLERLASSLKNRGNTWLARQIIRLSEAVTDNEKGKGSLSAEILESLKDRSIKYLKIREEYDHLLDELIHLHKIKLAHKIKDETDFLRYKMECDYERRENQYAYLDNSKSLIKDIHKYLKEKHPSSRLEQTLNSKLLSDTMHSPFPESFPFSHS